MRYLRKDTYSHLVLSPFRIPRFPLIITGEANPKLIKTLQLMKDVRATSDEAIKRIRTLRTVFRLHLALVAEFKPLIIFGAF